MSKSYIQKIKVLIVLLFSFGGLQAQIQPSLVKFEAQHTNGIVYLDWVFNSGSVCYGIVLERSEDSINFIEVGSIAGFCGSLTKPTTFSLQDNSPPLNRKLYYRLSYPGLGHSEVISITVVNILKNQYEANPTPSSGNTKLNFYNPKNELHTILVSNLSGLEVLQLETNESYFEFDTSELEPGIYQFFISNSNKSNIVSGRLLIAR
ncbi:MAG: hypothetical protein IT245_01900 [Bacteroidia bacterium]|nr:hypothetical protein [Bacteroidia bacterium]